MSNFWNNNPDLMMKRANALRCIVKEIEARRVAGVWSEGAFLATPILLSLAVEIALKAWQRKERVAPPEREHDLLKLFNALSEDTQKRISALMPEAVAPAILPEAASGIETALFRNRKLFVEWRYAYEHSGVVAETGILSMALDAIVDAYRSIETWKGFIGE
ncbi:MAG: hypothetical protein OXI33_11730 [Chloroflexota bacterium]|nr:hypothetical protein [Chloroflexota bacterium]